MKNMTKLFGCLLDVAGFFAWMKNMTKLFGCLLDVAGFFAAMKILTKLFGCLLDGAVFFTLMNNMTCGCFHILADSWSAKLLHFSHISWCKSGYNYLTNYAFIFPSTFIPSDSNIAHMSACLRA
jgi:hypothetical protein